MVGRLLKQCSLVVGDAQNLPLRNKTVEVLSLKEVLEHLPDGGRAIKEDAGELLCLSFTLNY